MIHLYRRAEAFAAGTISVLVLGETGAGKELVAQAIHRASPRRDKAFVRINCAALSDSMATSELFGHERGAFTGADRARPGLLAAADGGTVFLDEVAELTPSLQAALLRVVEQREVTPLGASRPRPLDVRFVCATNRRIEHEVRRQRFRHDLYFRLGAAILELPPLRERLEEIEPLARAFVERACRESGRPAPIRIHPDSIERLKQNSWPGNVRELKNVLDRAVLLCDGDEIRPEHLGKSEVSDIRGTVPFPASGVLPALDGSELLQAVGGTAGFGEIMLDPEAFAIKRALDDCCGNQTRAARLLNMSRGTLISRLEVYGFPRPRKGRT